MNIKNERTVIYFLVIISVTAIGIFTACNTARSERSNGVLVLNESRQVDKIAFPRPESHDAGWIEYHGDLYDLNWNNPGQQGNSCLTCHQKSDCLSCHNTSVPEDHTNTWRTFGHGFEADGDRERCLTCHRQDYCLRCHNETAPRSHKGNWSENHCGNCHYDTDVAFSSGCVTCHQQVLHLSAPHTINSQVECMECH